MEEDGEINEEADGKDAMKDTSREETSVSDTAYQNDGKQNHLRQSGSFNRVDGNKRAARMVIFFFFFGIIIYFNQLEYALVWHPAPEVSL